MIVDIERGITSSSSSTSLFSLIFFKQGLPEVLHAFFSLTSSPKFKVGTEFASKVLPTKWMVQTLLLSDGFHSVLFLFCLFKALIHLFYNSAFLNILGKQSNLNGGIQ